MHCQVFPDPSRDPLAGLQDKQTRLNALAEMLDLVEDLLVSRLGARRAPGLASAPPSGRRFTVDSSLAERELGLKGVRRITAGYASNGRAISVPSIVGGESVVHPLFAVDFGVEQGWPPRSRDLPFFRELSRILRCEDSLTFGYTMLA